MEEKSQNSNRIWLIMVLVSFLLLTSLLVGWLLFRPQQKPTPQPTVSSAPNLIEYSSPKGEIIKILTPQKDTLVNSPISLKGQVRGTWSFEGSFPVVVLDANGKELVNSFATLNGDWMTTEYVPFTANLIFSKPETATGKIILKKDNPSDNRALDDQLEITVKF